MQIRTRHFDQCLELAPFSFLILADVKSFNKQLIILELNSKLLRFALIRCLDRYIRLSANPSLDSIETLESLPPNMNVKRAVI